MMDTDALIERLRATKTQHRVHGLFGGAITIPDESETREVPINPNGPEAADRIESLLARIEAAEKVIRNLSTTPAVRQVLGSNHTSGCACPQCAAAQWQAGQEGEG